MTCPFCRAEAPPSPELTAYPLWRCACGALATGAPIYDIDEALDLLLSRCGVDEPASEAAVPVGTSGMLTAVPYDGPKAIARAVAILERAGFTTALTAAPPGTSGRSVEVHFVWARRAAPAATGSSRR